jgi:hypothetical protein
MTRYYSKFYNSEPMTELSEAEALAHGTYAELVDDPIQHYRMVIRRKLHTAIYPGQSDPAAAIAVHAAMYPNVPAHVYSPPVRDKDCVRWRTWYVNADGTLEKILEPETYERPFYRESYRGPDGELRSYTEYHYDEGGNLSEVVTYNPDGTVSSREDAD